METDIEKIKEKMIFTLKKEININSINEIVTASKITLTLDPINKLYVEIERDGITIHYSHEHEEFWLESYKNEDVLISDVIRLIALLFNNTILFNYRYFGSKLLGYKIWIVDEKGRQKLFKKVTISLNPLLRLKAKSIISKKLCFKNNP